jgi:two-component SAPR family response regulator
MTQLCDIRGHRVLIVDDNYLVATSMASVLQFAGAEITGMVPRLEQAMEVVRSDRDTFDVVVLDVDLDGTPSYPLAEMLDEYGIPYVFVTGYEELEPRFDDRPKCTKPVTAEALCAAVARLKASIASG